MTRSTACAPCSSARPSRSATTRSRWPPQTQLNQVQDLIAQGDWQQAQDKLVAVSNQVESVGDEEQKQQLLDQWNQLSAKVVQKDPEATVPPGITYTVPPSATDAGARRRHPERGARGSADQRPRSAADHDLHDAVGVRAKPRRRPRVRRRRPPRPPSKPRAVRRSHPGGSDDDVLGAGHHHDHDCRHDADEHHHDDHRRPGHHDHERTPGVAVPEPARPRRQPPRRSSSSRRPRSAVGSGRRVGAGVRARPGCDGAHCAATVPTAAATVPSPVVQAPETPPQVVITTTMVPVPQLGGGELNQR